jgi:alpha-glucosidase
LQQAHTWQVIDKHTWLQGAVIYQIYPRSFYDAKGTGIGGLQGIIDKLDYLGGTQDSLGVTAIWISPIYKSPMADFGYDVSDYTDIDPIFGTVADVEVLIAEAHKRNIKVILDFVPNHTSDEHPWFIESRSSLDNPKRNWYIWHDPQPDDGKVPNNWLSVFGGSAWELSKETGQYYLHSFLHKQPDLNWDNPEVREAMKTILRFWLDKGMDGFRMDAVDWLSKDPDLRNDPVDEYAINKAAGFDHESLKHTYSRDGPHLYERLNEMATVVAAYKDRFMITEVHPETEDKIAGYIRYYEDVNPLVSAPFNFQGIYLPWEAETFQKFVNNFQATMKPNYLPIYTIGNHDESRVASRIGTAAARTAAIMLLTLPGTVFVYYGEELGMTDVAIPENRLQDPFARAKHGRDPERTPMQWNDAANAGFTTGTPWLPVGQDYKQVNVAQETADPTSFLNLYKQLIALRKHSDALTKGSYAPIGVQTSVFAYRRVHENSELVILLNFTADTRHVFVAELRGTLIASTHMDTGQQVVHERTTLRPNEGVIIEVSHD